MVYQLLIVSEINDHLLPFGLSFGDQFLSDVDDGSSGPQLKDDPCPVFGIEEYTIYVRATHYS